MTQKRILPVKVGRLKPLYPNGWPKNLKAVLYLNNKQEVPASTPPVPTGGYEAGYGAGYG